MAMIWIYIHGSRLSKSRVWIVRPRKSTDTTPHMKQNGTFCSFLPWSEHRRRQGVQGPGEGRQNDQLVLPSWSGWKSATGLSRVTRKDISRGPRYHRHAPSGTARTAATDSKVWTTNRRLNRVDTRRSGGRLQCKSYVAPLTTREGLTSAAASMIESLAVGGLT